ncbi:FAD-dependent monooxygenase [Modestobacter versicolor]|uniref:FAD-dependent monooxygenase n=1 Tax=Modestobacter versicolor TaxID=429133 RepID=UPI0034DE20D5
MTRVGIVGAGIGGLSTAAGLQRDGVEVTVFERAPGPRPAGSGLSLFGNGRTALDALGLGDAIRSVTAAGPALLQAGQRRPDGRWLARTPASAVARLRVVHRADLHRVLLAALEPGTVRWGTPVRGVVPSSGEVLGEVLGQTRGERFDVVVAADGIRSAVRAGWPVDPGVRYAGYAAWRGVTAAPVDLRGAAGETWGRGLRFGAAPLADGRVYWFAVATMPARSPSGDEHARVQRLFGSWHDPVPELVAATPPDAVSRLDVEHLAGPLPTFRRERCVLLGDAAHAMTPDLGQGANQALEDAATLVALLRSPHRDVGTVLGQYDRLRRPRTQAVARRARSVGAVAQAAGRRAAVRDAVLPLVPAAVAARPLVRLQQWRPPPAPAVRTPARTAVH